MDKNKIIKRLKRSIKRNEKIINELQEIKDENKLSKCGYEEFGYFKGYNSAMGNILDEIEAGDYDKE